MLYKLLSLERPLACLDLETTGLDPEKDRIIQIGLTMHYPEKEPIKWATLVNPGCPILNDQHGIKDEHVADKPTFDVIGPALHPKMQNIDILGYNVTFDIKFLRASFARIGLKWDWDGHIIDPLHIYRMQRGHTLENAYIEYGGEDGQPLPPGSKLEGAHDAGIDVAATEIVLRGQLLRHSNLPRTVKELSDFCFPRAENGVDRSGKFIWVGNEVAINFGKWRGRKLSDPAVRGYLKWVAGADFPDDVKEIAEDAILGIYPTK